MWWRGGNHPSSVKLTIGPSNGASPTASAAGIGLYDGKYNSAGMRRPLTREHES